MTAVTIALVGDRRDSVVAHRCIPRALELAAGLANVSVTERWIPTPELSASDGPLAGCNAVWLVPASPYVSLDGALRAVRYAREHTLPFLGTCGGFQHALLEFARNVANLRGAEHAELRPDAEIPLLTALTCSLLEEGGEVHLTPGSGLRAAFGRDHVFETYHCRYGLNAAYRPVLESFGFRFTAFDDVGEIRGGELIDHPFFIGTLFQPERSALKEQAHPLITAFLSSAAVASAQSSGQS